MPKDSSNKSIRIKFKLSSPKPSEHEFKLYQNSSIQKIANIYCETMDLCLKDVEFFYKGSLLGAKDTLMSLNFKDGDIIQVVNNVKPTIIAESNQIILKVTSSDNHIIGFKTFRNQPLEKLMNTYCDRMDISKFQALFYHEGRLIHPNDTPNFLNMHDDDTVKVILEDPIVLKVIGLDRSVTKIRTFRNEPLKKLKDVYYEKNNFIFYYSKTELRFCFDGRRILDEDTPNSLDMDEENNEIEIFIGQSAGF